MKDSTDSKRGWERYIDKIEYKGGVFARSNVHFMKKIALREG